MSNKQEELKKKMAEVKQLQKEIAAEKKKALADKKAAASSRAAAQPIKDIPIMAAKPNYKIIEEIQPKRTALVANEAYGFKGKRDAILKITNNNYTGYFKLYMVKQDATKTYKNHQIRTQGAKRFVVFFQSYITGSADDFNYEFNELYTRFNHETAVHNFQKFITSDKSHDKALLNQIFQSYTLDGFELTELTQHNNNYNEPNILHEPLHNDAENLFICGAYTM